MAQWWIRGIAVAGVLTFGWAAHGQWFDPVPSVAARASSSEPISPGARPGGERRDRKQVVESLGRLPLRFEANAGQFPKGVRFAARGTGYNVALTPAGAVIDVGTADGPSAAIAMTLVGRHGARAARDVTGRELLPGVVNHIIGNDPAAWTTGAKQFARVRHSGVYDGIDLEFYGNQQRLEYDFLVAPGADPSTIRLRFDGAARLEIDAAGDLLVHAAGGLAAPPAGARQLSAHRRRSARGREPLRPARRERRGLLGRPVRSDAAADHRSGADLLVVLRRNRGRSRPSTSRSIRRATST